MLTNLSRCLRLAHGMSAAPVLRLWPSLVVQIAKHLCFANSTTCFV